MSEYNKISGFNISTIWTSAILALAAALMLMSIAWSGNANGSMEPRVFILTMEELKAEDPFEERVSLYGITSTLFLNHRDTIESLESMHRDLVEDAILRAKEALASADGPSMIEARDQLVAALETTGLYSQIGGMRP